MFLSNNDKFKDVNKTLQYKSKNDRTPTKKNFYKHFWRKKRVCFRLYDILLLLLNGRFQACVGLLVGSKLSGYVCIHTIIAC